MNLRLPAVEKTHEPGVFPKPFLFLEREIFHAENPRRSANEDLRGLHSAAIACASSEPAQGQSPIHITVEYPDSQFFCDMCVKEAVRKTDEIGGKSVPANVRRLPKVITRNLP